MQEGDPNINDRPVAVVQSLLREISAAPMDVYGASGGAAEIQYLRQLGKTYIRTVNDMLAILPPPSKSVRILEIGAYQGIVSLALSKLGYSVEVFDIPDILQSPALRARYDASGIVYHSGDLAQGKLPLEDGWFDCVIACEVIEHLNFNPLPSFSEVNRVTKLGGFFYIGMPNQARLGNRVRALLGKSTHEPIDLFFRLCCDRTFRVGLHWREYTMAETMELVTNMGYSTARSYFYGMESGGAPLTFRDWLLWLPRAFFPSLKSLLVFVGRKERESCITWPPGSP